MQELRTISLQGFDRIGLYVFSEARYPQSMLPVKILFIPEFCTQTPMSWQSAQQFFHRRLPFSTRPHGSFSSKFPLGRQ
jgi:hypothetical protein